MSSQLTFERKFQPKKSGVCSEARNYVDFLIDNIALSKILGDVNNNLGKFGWGITEYQIQELNELKLKDESRLNNSLFSIYVCAECGDEGCMAVMFRKTTIADKVIWSDFVWSNGYYEIDDSHDKFDIEPIVFDKIEYENQLDELKKMIIN